MADEVLHAEFWHRLACKEKKILFVIDWSLYNRSLKQQSIIRRNANEAITPTANKASVKGKDE